MKLVNQAFAPGTTIVLALALTVGIALHTQADDDFTGFAIKPARCVTLHRGQVCYQKLKLVWETPTAGTFCLVESALEAPEQARVLICWQGDERNGHRLEFASASNLIYQIKRPDKDEVLAEIEVEVAWVYKAGRTSFSRWRLF